MAAVTINTPPATGPVLRGPVPGRTSGPAIADRSPATVRPSRAIRSWPLLVLAAPAAAEVWSGWVGIAQRTGFGLVSPLPGIWPSLHVDTAITLPVGVEAYAAYALRAWLASEHTVSARTRRFAKWSAIFSFTLGMAGQIAYHLLAQADAARAPWPVTTIVSCLPVLVLAMGTTLAHMLRADAIGHGSDAEITGPAVVRSADWSSERPTRDQAGPDQDRPVQDGPDPQDRRPPLRKPVAGARTTGPESRERETADGPGAPNSPQAGGSRETGITASAAQRGRQGLQRGAERHGPHPNCRTSRRQGVAGRPMAWPPARRHRQERRTRDRCGRYARNRLAATMHPITDTDVRARPHRGICRTAPARPRRDVGGST
jgi:hypothetical protein